MSNNTQGRAPEDPYPTEDDLERIRTWDHNDHLGLMDFVHSLWMWPDWGWRQKGRRFWISTGGWSGNESLIGALMDNHMFWALCWISSRRGGHYHFHVRRLRP